MYSEVNFAPKAPNLPNSICIEINFFKFRRKHHSYQLVAVFRDLPNRRSTGFNAYWHWVISTSIFRKSWKSIRNSKVPIEGIICLDPVLGPFLATFFLIFFTSTYKARKSRFRNANSILIFFAQGYSNFWAKHYCGVCLASESTHLTEEAQS